MEAAARQLAQSQVVAVDLGNLRPRPANVRILLWAFKGESTPVYLVHGEACSPIFLPS